MEIIKSVCGVVILGLILGCVHAKPQWRFDSTTPIIKNMGSETIVDATHNLELLCEGREKITWTYPNNTVQEETFWSTVHIDISESNNKHFAKLTLLNASYVDVGYYYCHAEDAAKDDPRRSAKIYVYVRDEEHLSSYHSDFMFLTAHQHTTFILPCKPTAPDVEVKLLDIYDEEMTLPYDDRVGFSLYITSLLQSGHYKCIFTRGDNTQDSSVVVSVRSDTEYVPKPYIQAPNNGRTRIGESYVINCTVTVDPQVYFNLEWKIPSSIGNRTGRITTTKATVKDDPHGKQGSSSLIIKNVELEDDGEYTCTIIDHTQKNNSVSKNITVFRENGSYINLQEETGMSTINMTAGTNVVQWVVLVDSYPKAEILWKNNNGEEINSVTRNTKYSTSFDSNTSKATLKITQLTLNDSGIYQITANNGKSEKNLNFSLNVQDRPAVIIESPNYHLINKNTSVKCIAAGNPIPTVEWYFKPCQNNSCTFMRIPSFLYTIEKINLQVISTLTMNATSTGFVQCYASNVIANDTVTQAFLVTDVENGFKIWSSERNDQIAAGSDVTLYCAVSKYSHTRDIRWYYRDKGTNKIRISPNKKYKIGTNSTEYTYRGALTIHPVSKNDSGIYVCETDSLETEREDPRYLRITVKNPEAPKINSTNMNNSTIQLPRGKDIRWYCMANGIPTPRIVWKKDGVNFGVNNSRVTLSNDKVELSFRAVLDEDAGTYTCEAYNSKGVARRSMMLDVIGGGSNTVLITITTILFAFFLILVVILALKIRKEKKRRLELKNCGLQHFEAGALECLNPDLGIDEQAELLPYDKKWEFPRDKLKLGKQLGSGAFGVVMKAEAFGIVEGETITTVAVKMVKRNADYTYIKALASELKIMVHLGKHLNVVNLLGACTKNVTKRELFVIVEYCRFGNLHNYLLRHRDDFVNQIDTKTGQIDTSIGADLLSRTMSVSSNQSGTRNMAFAGVDYRATPNLSSTTDSTIVCSPSGEDTMILSNNSSVQPEWRSNYRGDYKGNVRPTSTHDLLCWSFQVARGMEYLASRKVMHGDLAARNILLAEDNIVKICDFGLAKSIYKSDNYKKKGDGPLPVKWMAVESIRDRVFSTQSDVWSYGIVLWELFSLARTPYPGMDADERLYNKLVDGYRMDQPEFATKEIYQIMMECWHAKPVYRPTFSKLADDLGNMLQDAVRKHYIDLNDPYIMMNTEQLAGHSDYLAMACAPDYGNLASPGHEYVNGKLPEAEPEASGYLPMNIFSPTRSENVFDFEVPKNKNVDGETCTGVELLPMLNAPESDSESPGPVKSFSNPNYQSNISEPKKDSIVTSDNYINMPKQKNSIKTNADSFTNPSYITMNNKNINLEENDKSNYVNSHSRDWERPVV